MSSQPKTFITPEQYLEIERAAEFKSEYYGGEMFAMAGAVRAHNLIAVNASRVISNQLLDRPCESYSNDMRVLVRASNLYTYPDLVVVCGEPQFLDQRQDTLLNPNLIIEVLSHSTEAYDRGRKFEHYKSIESLREYLLIASEYLHADLFNRQPDGRWLMTSVNLPEDWLDLQSVGCRLTLADLYKKVEFA